MLHKIILVSLNLTAGSIDVSLIVEKLKIQRFPEIEAILNTNNPEDELFRTDIESLKKNY